MANQSVSPNEAEVAKSKLKEMKPVIQSRPTHIKTYPPTDIFAHKMKVSMSFDGGKTYQTVEYDMMNGPIIFTSGWGEY